MELKKLLKTHNAVKSVLKYKNKYKASDYKGLKSIDEKHTIIRYVLLKQ